ncbi:ACT domain-containing protein [Streptomyces mauvecolor]|uniref:ACT domain-containing protein n=1 Tax=Streptomyces mauvecolor TaxID=58345 RepID=A0ABV9UUD3_9ACTN
MNGDRDLRTLLGGIRPELNPGRYVLTLSPGPLPADLTPAVLITEPEGVTLVVRQEQADAAALAYDYVVGWITLSAQCAIEAVGLTAAVATELAAHGISCNVVAGYHHDHLFVPYERAEEAVGVLNDLALRAS